MSQDHLPTGAKRFGYFVSIIVNAALIYVVNNLLNWNIPFLTEHFSECLFWANLSLGVSMFINFIFMFFDRKWFHNLMQAIGNVFSFISAYVFWRVFPLDLPGNMKEAVNVALIILLVLVLLSILVELVNAIRNYNRETAV